MTDRSTETLERHSFEDPAERPVAAVSTLEESSSSNGESSEAATKADTPEPPDNRTEAEKRMDAKIEPYKAQLESIELGTREVDMFIQIIERVLEPLAEESNQSDQRFDTYRVILRVVRRHALPELNSWYAEISGIDFQVVDRDIYIQSQILKSCREQGLGDFLGEWLRLLGPVIL